MECMVGSLHPPAVAIVRPPLTYASRAKKLNGLRAKPVNGLRAKLSEENDPLLLSAIDAASLRFQETHRPVSYKVVVKSRDNGGVEWSVLKEAFCSSWHAKRMPILIYSYYIFPHIDMSSLITAHAEPLFVDPYAGCFVSPNSQMDMKKCSHQYCIATKFIDDKLLRTVNHMDGLKQVVLLTDGMDTRPYRLNWPSSTIIFDVSPDRIFKNASEKLTGVGAKTPRSCLFLHVPLDSSSLQESLHAKGFNNNQPSVWAIQGLPLMTLASFEEILLTVSGLAMSGCSFVGELPAWLAETEIGTKTSTKTWMDKLFMSNGFQVNMINYEEVAKSLGKKLAPGDLKNILFTAEQLQLSDGQMETWRRESQRVEEEGNEDGFDEL